MFIHFGIPFLKKLLYFSKPRVILTKRGSLHKKIISVFKDDALQVSCSW